MSRILLATDGSPGANEALRLLIELRPHPEDVIHVLCAADHGLMPPGGGDRADEHADAITEAAVARLRYAGVAAIGERASGSPARAIVDTATRIGADLIVLGSRGRRRWTAALLGSTARVVTHGTSTPTLVVRGRAAAPRWTLLACVELAGIRPAARALGRLPCPPETAIDVLVPSAAGSAPELPHVAEVFEEARRALPGLDLRVHAADPRGFGAEVHRYAEQLAADLVVLAPGPGGEGLSDEVVGGSHCPVLVVPVPAIPIQAAEAATEIAVAL